MDWKHTFLFLVVAIPSVAILTRVIAWLVSKKKTRTAPPAVREGGENAEPRVGKPYATHEEYMNDLRGTVDLEEFLARCRAGVPEDSKKAALASDNAKIQSARERLAAVKGRLDRKTAHDKMWDGWAENLRRMMAEEAAKAGARLLKSFNPLPNAAVPVIGGAGGAGGDGSDGVLITGMGSPPPANDQPRLKNVCSECNGVGTHLFTPCTGKWMLNVPR